MCFVYMAAGRGNFTTKAGGGAWSQIKTLWLQGIKTPNKFIQNVLSRLTFFGIVLGTQDGIKGNKGLNIKAKFVFMTL